MSLYQKHSKYDRPEKIHTEKSFRNLIKSTWNQIVFTIFRLIWIQTDVRLDPNQSENGKYNLISDWLNKIKKKILCVYDRIDTLLPFINETKSCLFHI